MIDFKGAIFDLDGTIIDSMGVWEKIDRDFFNKRQIDMPHDYIEIVNSMKFEDVAKYTIKRFNLNETEEDILRELREMAIDEYTNNISLKPFVKKYLTSLKKQNIKIALATSSPKELYNPVLKNNGVYELFDCFVSINEVNRDKRYPDIYYLACERLGVLPKECIGFEDILIGIKSMKKINIKSIGVYDKSSSHEIEEIKKFSDKFIYSFKELI